MIWVAQVVVATALGVVLREHNWSLVSSLASSVCALAFQYFLLNLVIIHAMTTPDEDEEEE